MFELIVIAVTIWLLAKCIGLAFDLTWSLVKVFAGVLMVMALPVLILCLLFAGGIVLLAPIVMLVVAAGILKACL